MPEKRHRFPPELLHRSRELRQPLTPAERKLWTMLRNRNLAGYKFRRQHLIGHFIVDFYCAQVRLVVEIDGDIHSRQVEYDAARTAWFVFYTIPIAPHTPGIANSRNISSLRSGG